MKHILIPIDFTSVSMNALKYAIDCFPDSKLTLLHVRSSKPYPNKALFGSSNFAQQNSLETSIKSFIKKELHLQVFPQHINIVIDTSTNNDRINQFAKNNDVDCIVMGTGDNYNFIDKWYGTISLGIINNSSIPVYLIPRYARYRDQKNQMVTTDRSISNATRLRNPKTWNKYQGAHPNFLQVHGRG